MTVKFSLSIEDDTLEDILTYTDPSPTQVKHMLIEHRHPTVSTGNNGKKSYVQLRNLRNPDKEVETCLNNVGSFQCVGGDMEERVAIGFGGYTDNSGARPSQFSVIRKDGTVCIDHKIPTKGGALAPAIGVVGKWLWACGGEYSQACQKLNMEAHNPSWQSAPSIPYNVYRHMAMYTYDGYLYILGGWYSSCRNHHYRISENGQSWESRASFHINIMKHTPVVDHINGKVYILGGSDCSYDRADARVYTFSSNSWSYISNLPWSYPDYAGAIIKQKSGERWLVVQRRSQTQIRYWNIDQNNGWHHISDNPYYHKTGGMPWVSFDEHTTYMFGGETNKHGRQFKNFWQYNIEKYKFEGFVNKFVPLQHIWGYWTTAPKTMKIFQNCAAERTYAAVGWGGTDWVWILQNTEITRL